MTIGRPADRSRRTITDPLQAMGLLATAMVVVALSGLSLVQPARAADSPIQVPIAASVAGGPTGLVTLLPTADGGTTVQVVAQGAPDGASVAIHPGTCEAVGADLTGLVGNLSAAGQVASTIPVGIATLADGAHVIAIHPGLDVTRALACGAVPATAIDNVVPPLGGEGGGQENPAQPGCDAVRAWITATTTRLDQLQKLQDDANRAGGGTDVQAYLSVVATNMGVLRSMVLELRAQALPPEAASLQEQLINALTTAFDSGDLLLRAFTDGDPTAYQDALAKGKAANDLVLKVRTGIGELGVKCPAPVPAAGS